MLLTEHGEAAGFKAGFECSFAKKPLKPGPKGPRQTTSNRIKKQLDDIRTSGGTPKRSPSSELQSCQENGLHSSIPEPIAFSDVCAYLEMFHYKMYPIWPVVDRTFLIHCLGEDMKDPELSALAFAVCAATGAQLRLCSEPNPTTKFEQTSLCDRLAIEAEKRRLEYDYREGATVSGVLVPFFLHAYYTKKRRRYSSTLYIREAVTLAQLLGMDREASYVGLPPQEAHFRRKIFWLLFVTERGHSMQYGVAALLRPSVDLPQADDDKDPHLILAFLSLVRLFVAVDGMLAGEGVDDPGRIFTPESLEGLQRQLGHQPDFPPFSNEVQKTDVFITQQWMRMLLWQLSMKKVSLTASGPDNPLSLTYPDQIARDALSFLTRVSLDSVIAHGPGMELKIFEIANTLLDGGLQVRTTINLNKTKIRLKHHPHHLRNPKQIPYKSSHHNNHAHFKTFTTPFSSLQLLTFNLFQPLLKSSSIITITIPMVIIASTSQTRQALQQRALGQQWVVARIHQ
ncbi:putative aflyd sugr sugar regulator [Phaeomoniella chlamydospora]|uniref:Putative aflyd sugr sugar regulator n=1 Tax=Phaeomoniella chlamydospora TaxID=158046 RepID=A0A0G2GLE2_PHACM|nr:putative aflyd sugr sugar regulator [Phaeomoniella chlamydospora]